MKKFVLHLLLTATICLALFNCKHRVEVPEVPYDCGDAQTINEMKEWVLFKVGSYWIYEEETSGMLDTVTVISYFDGFSEGGFVDFSTVMHSSLDDYNYEYWFNESYSGISSQDNCFGRRIQCSKAKPGAYFGSGYVFVFPLRQGRTAAIQTTTALDGLFRITNYPTPWTGTIDTLPNCAIINSPYSVQHAWHESNYIISKNVGILQKEIFALGEKWKLIEYQVYQ